MPVKEITNSKLFKEIQAVKSVAMKNSVDITKNSNSIFDIRNDISNINNDISGIKKDIYNINNDIYNIKNDISGINKDLFEIKRDVVDIKDRIKLFPEFFEKVDKLVGEIVENRQEKAVMFAQIDDHEKRITRLESK